MQTTASSLCIRPPFLPRTPVRAADQALEACHSRQFTPPRALQAGGGRGKWGPGALHLRWTPETYFCSQGPPPPPFAYPILDLPQYVSSVSLSAEVAVAFIPAG